MKIKAIVGIISIYIILSLAYIYNYYHVINLSNIVVQLVIQNNYLINCIRKTINALISTVFDKDVFKLIIIIITGVYVLRTYSIIDKIFDLIKLIKRVDIKGISIVIDEVKEDIQKTENEIKKLSEDNNDSIQLTNAKLKKQVLELMIDRPNIVELIDQYLNFNYKRFKIPRNHIPIKFELKDIEQIFITKVTGSKIEILGMKNEIEPIVAEVFNDLLHRGIIYSKLN